MPWFEAFCMSGIFGDRPCRWRHLRTIRSAWEGVGVLTGIAGQNVRCAPWAHPYRTERTRGDERNGEQSDGSVAMVGMTWWWIGGALLVVVVIAVLLRPHWFN